MGEPAAPDFLASEIESRSFENAFFHIIPVPLEKSVSYGPGTQHGPRAILEASQQLETWDGESNPSERGIHTIKFHRLFRPRRTRSAADKGKNNAHPDGR